MDGRRPLQDLTVIPRAKIGAEPAGSFGVSVTAPIGVAAATGIEVFVLGLGDLQLHRRVFSGADAEGNLDLAAAWEDLGGPPTIPDEFLRPNVLRVRSTGVAVAEAYVRGFDGHIWRWNGDWADRGAPGSACPAGLQVGPSEHGADVLPDGTILAVDCGGNLHRRTASGWSAAPGKPGDTRFGVGAIVAVEDDTAGPLVFAPGLMNYRPFGEAPFIRYLYEWRDASRVWRNHGTFRPDVPPETRAIELDRAPNTEPDIAELHGHLIAVARWRECTTVAGTACQRKLTATAYSLNDGITWIQGPTLPEDTGGENWFSCTGGQSRDAAVAFGPDGKAYVVMQMMTPTEGNMCPCSSGCPGEQCRLSTPQGIEVIMFRSDDGGASYEPCQPFGDDETNAIMRDSAIDKVNVAVATTGPSAGRVYVSYSRGVVDTSVRLRWSDDGCATWEPNDGSGLLGAGDEVAVGPGWPSGLQVGPFGLVVADSAVGDSFTLNDGVDEPVEVRFLNDGPAGVDSGAAFTSLGSPGEMSGNDLNFACADCFEDGGCGADTPADADVWYGTSWPGVAVSSLSTGIGIFRTVGIVSGMAQQGYDLAFNYNRLACLTFGLDGTCVDGGWGAESSPDLGVFAGEHAGPAVDVLVNDVGGEAVFQTFASWYWRPDPGADDYHVLLALGTLPGSESGAIAWQGPEQLTSESSSLGDLQIEGGIRHAGHHRFSRGAGGLHSHPVWLDTRGGNQSATAYTTFVTPVLW